MMETQTPEHDIYERLVALGATIASAESCSGGLAAHRITNVAGSSSVYLGGFVTYSNDAKAKFLAVPESMLETHGAVSEPVARAMAEGARNALSADYGFGVTGIAGPGGGTAEKPVGLVYMAVSGPDGTRVAEHHFEGDRESIKTQTAQAVLEMVVEELK